MVSFPREPPATRDDLRALRRWVVIAGVWAVAATAVALIALIDTSGGRDERRAGDATARRGRVERELLRRIGALEKRVDGLAESGDVSRLEERLTRAESDATGAGEDAASAERKASALEDRVKRLEETSPAGAGDLQP